MLGKKLKNKKYLGQHFLVDPNIVKRIIHLSKIDTNSIIYEVGTGNGILTKELCNISKLVYSYEIDPICYHYCKKNLLLSNLILINSDGFNDDSKNFDVFFSSLPYYESRNAFNWLFQKNFKKGILLLQKEFVDKLLSIPGKKNYRAISVLCQHRFSIDILLDVPFSSFSPIPRVSSVLIEISPKLSPLSKKTIDDIQFLFSFRKKNISFLLKYFNKQLQKNDEYFDIDKYKDKKLGQLSVEQIFQLYSFLKNYLF